MSTVRKYPYCALPEHLRQLEHCELLLGGRSHSRTLITQQQKEIEELNNIINEIEDILNNFKSYPRSISRSMECENTLELIAHKLQEFEESKQKGEQQ